MIRSVSFGFNKTNFSNTFITPTNKIFKLANSINSLVHYAKGTPSLKL